MNVLIRRKQVKINNTNFGSNIKINIKGGYIAQSKNLKFDSMILYDRVGLDKFEGTGKTVNFGLICLPDTKEKPKNRFSQIVYSGHVIGSDEKLFVQGSAKRSNLQYTMVKL